MSTTTPTTTSDTSAIDDKKNNVSGININQQTILQYIKAVFPSIIRAFIYFTLGSLVLYGTFSAQSGIFPTNMDYYPYTEKIPNYTKDCISNIYETDDGKYSQKLFFDYDTNRKGNSLLDFLRSLKKPGSNVVSVFFTNIIQHIIRLDFGSLSELLITIREFELNSFYIILFGPIVLISYILIFLLFVNPIYFIYLWFMNLGLFMQRDINNPSSDYYGMSEMSYWYGVGLIFLFIIIFFMLFGFFGFIISFVSVFTVIFAIIRYKCNFNLVPNVGFGTILKNNFLYYKNILAILISIPLITNANDILGGIGAAIVIVALLLVYAKTSFYQPKELDKLSPFIPEIPNTIKQNGAPVSYINNPKNVVYI